MTERLYSTDSFLRRFAAAVTNIREHSRGQDGSRWQLTLDRSAFYPTGGGQPHDSGELEASAPSGAAVLLAVSDVEEDGSGELWHTVPKPVAPGTEVTGSLDWERRFDHMQQHSGQHLLSAVIARELGAMTVSFHLGTELSTIDLDRELTAAECLHAERAANSLAAENRCLRIHTLAREQAEEMLRAGRLRKLPARSGAIRVIEIEEYDWNACGGTHVAATGQIGAILLRGRERVRQGTRLEFACGTRAVRHARSDYEVLSAAARAAGVPAWQLDAQAARLAEESRAAGRQTERMRERLAEAIAASLPAAEDGRIEYSGSDGDPVLARMVATRAAARAPGAMALAVTPLGEAEVSIVLAAGAEAGLHCGELLRRELGALGLRGGGGPTLAQAQVPAPASPLLLARLREECGKAALRRLSSPSSGC
jgi:alanyl-tRNA synthetase